MEHNNFSYQNIITERGVRLAVVGVLVLLGLILLVQSIQGIQSAWFAKSEVPVMRSISVEGTGSAFATPDIATVSFRVQVEQDSIAQAQTEATELTKEAIAYLTNAGIAEKDIQTTSYNVQPVYDYIQEACMPGVPCRGGTQQLRGYQVSQSISVKVRDTAAVGDVLAGLGDLGVQNISGPNFAIDDIDAVRQEARKEAIAHAEEKAKVLAKELGVRLVGVVGFWEERGGYPYPMYDRAMNESAGYGGDDGMMVAPSVPAGENEVQVMVNVTYEIR